MKQTFFLTIFSLLLMAISCERNKSPLALADMNFPQQLTSSGYDMVSYWSPNMEYIAFLTVRNTFDPTIAAVRFELWIMNYDGSDQHPLILINDLYEGEIMISGISWSTDSHYMLVKIYTPNGSEIWRVNLDGSKTRLSSTHDWTERPKYSPDGLKIAFLIQGPNPPQGSPVYRLYVSNPDFSESVIIDSGLIQDFAWKSNSNEIIYSLYDRANENYELWISYTTGNEKLQFSNTLDSEEYPSCSIDGKYIAYSVQNTVYVTLADTFQIRKVMDNARLPKWVPNNNLLLISSEQTLDNESFWTESWIIDLEGDIIKKIVEGKHSQVSFSSNGEYFVYTLDGNLWIDKF